MTPTPPAERKCLTRSQSVLTKTVKSSEKPGRNKSKELPNILTENQATAILLYTMGGKNPIYREFNEAVRSGRATYKKTFKYRALHFLLTDALKQLKQKQQDCFTVYRRTKVNFETDPDPVNKEIRLGSFTSCSQLQDLSTFGEKSCFIITTCHGAALEEYSYLPHEKEVLIPPYETFKVVKVEKRSENKDLWCDVVFTLISTGTISNLDCTHVGC